MTVTKAELSARTLIDDWIGGGSIQLSPQDRRYRSLVEKVQAVVADRDLIKKHADEGWKLANTRTAERQEILKSLKALIKATGRGKAAGSTSLSAARAAAQAVVDKFKPLLEG